MKTDLFIFAGEASGDLLGGQLIKALNGLSSMSISGVGGPQMRSQAFHCVVPMEEFQVMGYSDVIWALPRLWKHFHKIKKMILEENPKGVVLIDYPGWSLRLAKALRGKGYKGKIIQYVCPSVWAYGKKRIDLLAQHYDSLLTLFPFEPSYFAHTSLQVKCVGHPLTEKMAEYNYDSQWKNKYHIPSDATLISLFPGSRRGEIERNLPYLVETAQIIQKKMPSMHLGISVSQEDFSPRIVKSLPKNLPFSLIPSQHTYELMHASHSAIAKSGTVNLELCLHACPALVVYKLSWMNYLIAKYLLKVNLPFYSIVNIIAAKQIYPEVISTQIDPQHLAKLWENHCLIPSERKKCFRSCHELKQQLSYHQPSLQAAQAIVDIL